MIERVHGGSSRLAGSHQAPVHSTVIGIGSPRGDDRAGWEVVEELSSRRCPCDRCRAATFRTAAVPHDILDWLQPEVMTHVVDASLEPQPSVRRFEIKGSANGKLTLWQRPSRQADSDALNAAQAFRQESIDFDAFANLRSSSTHQFELLATLQLAAVLHRLPTKLVLWTIGISTTSPNGALTCDESLRMDATHPSTTIRITQCARQLIREVCCHA